MSSAAPARAPAASAGLASLYTAMLPPRSLAPVVDVNALTNIAYRQGFSDGSARAEAALAAERALLAAAREAFVAAMMVDPDTLRGLFLTLVGTLARTVIAAELRLNPDVMARLIDTALAAVTAQAGIIVRVHPDDVSQLDTSVTADPLLPRGSVVVEAGAVVIADGLDARLAALIDELL